MEGSTLFWALTLNAQICPVYLIINLDLDIKLVDMPVDALYGVVVPAPTTSSCFKILDVL